MEGGGGREKTKEVGRPVGKEEGWKKGRMDRGRLIDVRTDERKKEGREEVTVSVA